MANEDKKISPQRAKKETIVAEISTQLASAKGVVFANYQGLTHKQIENLKKGLKEASATFTVTKNTLLKLSLDKSDQFKNKVSESIFNDPTAVIFISGDPMEALKKLAKATKDFGFPKLKSGILDGATLDEAQLIKLSTLPNRNTLIAQFVGTLNSPIQGLVVVLNGNLQKLAMTLQAISNIKSQMPNVQPEPQAPTQDPVAAEPAQTDQIQPEPQAQPTEQVQTAPLAQAETLTEQTSENNEQTNDKGGENTNS